MGVKMSYEPNNIAKFEEYKENFINRFNTMKCADCEDKETVNYIHQYLEGK